MLSAISRYTTVIAVSLLFWSGKLFAQQDIALAGTQLFRQKNGIVPTRLTAVEKIDSIAMEECPGSAFAGIYSLAMKNIAEQIRNFDSSAQAFVNKFEMLFAEYFLTACKNYPSTNSAWNFLFAHPKAETWQQVLFGVNTHINIDMADCLYKNFSHDEIICHRRELLAIRSSISKVYREYFGEVFEYDPYLRFINSFTHGLAQLAGERWVLKWRKRSVTLALLHYGNPEKFRRKQKKMVAKKNRIDRIILEKKKFFL